MRCAKMYLRNRCNACVQCGAPMPIQETVCSKCGAEEKTLISFPWLKCPRCRKKQWSFDFHIDKITWWILGFGLIFFLIGGLGMFFSKTTELVAFFSRFAIAGILLCGASVVCYIALSIEPRKFWWIMWQPFSGILIALFGILTLSKASFFVGIIFMATWYFSQRCHYKVFEFSEQKIAAALQRDRFEAVMNPDIPEDVKKLKDMNDAEKALVWKMNNVFSKRWLFRLLGFTALVLVLVCKGPGDFYRKEIIEAAKNGIETVNIKIQPTILDTQKRLNTINKKEALKDKLIMCNLTGPQIYEILNFGDFDALMEMYEWKRAHNVARGEIYNELKKEIDDVIKCKQKGLSVNEFYKLNGVGLSSKQIAKIVEYELVEAANKLSKEKLRGYYLYRAVIAEQKKQKENDEKISVFSIISNYFKKVRREMWMMALLLLIVLLGGDLIFIICTIASSIAHRIYSMADEVNDRLKYAWSKVIEKQRKKEALAQNKEYTPRPEHEDLGKRIKEKGLTWLDVVGIDALMEIGQLILHKLHPEWHPAVH